VRTLALVVLFAPPLAAQFDLQVLDANGARPAPAVLDLGQIYSGEAASARFQLRNTTAAPATLGTLTVAGVGFSLSGPALPVSVGAQASVEFTARFSATDVGSYSAVLRAENVSVLLTATVAPRLTYRVENMLLGASVDFGSVQRGSAARRRFTITNETAIILTVPAISVQGADFTIAGPPPSGLALQPAQGAEFAIDFTPGIAGTRQGTLTIGDRSYALIGTGVEPPLPKPLITIDLKQARSAQQGSLIIAFDQPAAVSGTGTVTLDFRGPADPTVALATGGRTAIFPIAPGDTGVTLRFQTGTTSGTITFKVQVGDASDQASVEIASAPAALTAVQGVRTGGGIEVRVTGYDNTRSAGQLSYTFFDAAGNPVSPGAIRVDASADFAKFFASSDAGGTFLLRAVFPVTGDPSQVTSFEVAVTNSVAATKSIRTAF
jgi:hypothetical protein